MGKRVTISILIITCALCSLTAQTATVKTNRDFRPQGMFTDFDSIKFQFNDTYFTGADTTTKVITLNSPFDICKAIIENDTIVFLTKFKPNEEYIIQAGCCCAAFTLRPQKGGQRGTVTFKNTTSRELFLSVCEHNVDTIKPDISHTVFASESAMCYFKPCSIFVAEMIYLAQKYYPDDNTDHETWLALWEEQKTHIISEVCFHFLHGEKIEVFFNKKINKIELKLNGYLSDKEIEKLFE